MKFYVLGSGHQPPTNEENVAFLVRVSWNDYWRYLTLYTLYYVNSNNELIYIGEVKFGKFNFDRDQVPILDIEEFTHLDEMFFSLGQDESYYTNLTKYFGEDQRYHILKSLRDVALDEDLFDEALNEPVMGTSLLRNVNRATVRGRFRRAAKGDASLTPYNFTYFIHEKQDDELGISFNVIPESFPPTNMHVLIGRNGVGKTRLLNNMIKSLIIPSDIGEDYGKFTHSLNDKDIFANLVSVSFSAFDSTEAIKEVKNNSKGMRYSYIGLKNGVSIDKLLYKMKNSEYKEENNKIGGLKDFRILKKEFIESLKVCLQGARIELWYRAILSLESDPIFKELSIGNLTKAKNYKILEETAGLLFDKLSSGHCIVLLTITKLIEKVEERTLVIIDEPEAHLHPPLLSAFIRTLSNLLIYRNGVAIIATHSPVIIQEVPRSCVWKMRRTVNVINFDRPRIETFGENINTLTHEVFGLEVENSGFHKVLFEVVNKYDYTYKEVLEHFNNQLGIDAKMIVQILLAEKSKDE